MASDKNRFIRVSPGTKKTVDDKRKELAKERGVSTSKVTIDEAVQALIRERRDKAFSLD